ncbi:MAG: hypothetical protein COA96_11905 [SAR86 cluster bacterium]|uniref:FecR protein domain-containing protein n=1 Tax=SAR86 cluster bacterium TaxID=2030880 RepID=A0A2A5AXC8_9GAMM|nr:MAG: hypothetical protein COA96_11905 [SAR86 cluster bacterium]
MKYWRSSSVFKHAKLITMNISIPKFIILTTLGCFFILSSSAQLNLAGRVVATIGQIEVVRFDGTHQAVIRRSDINVGDTIKTFSDSMVQLRFVDSGLVSLCSDSELKIVQYQYQGANSDRVELYLVKGKLRTITGEIKGEAYLLVVNGARISNRGTDYEVAIVGDEQAYVGVYTGGITITNELGEVNLGIGADYDFASLRKNFASVGSLLQPPDLGGTC